MSTGRKVTEKQQNDWREACGGAGQILRSCLVSSYPSLVIDTLKEVDETRKCYRMVGGVLVERTVKEVLPALEGNKEQVSKNS